MANLSEAEKQQRLLAIGSVIGTNKAEGIELDATVHALLERFAAGEMDLQEFSSAMQLHAHSIAASAPMVGAA